MEPTDAVRDVSPLPPPRGCGDPDLRRTLRATFGFEEFRTGQTAVIDSLMQGQSALAVFPTGSGKSLCYQLPALHLEGLTLVISPLIALMKDQLDFLESKGIAAARLDSSLTREESMEVHERLRNGDLKLLYVSPERLSNERFTQTLGRRRISLMAIDESHCISQWGHNFRPDYIKIPALARDLQVERVLALTATATPSVTADIMEAFGIRTENAVLTGFHRPNLQLHMTPITRRNRFTQLLDRLKSRPAGPTIVYVTLQKTAEEVARRLQEAGFLARAYHAGMESETRTAVQDAFMASDEMIVVATIAFGMGVDKADIRAIYHLDLPKSMENYMQEIGRAGRDQDLAICEVLASGEDMVTLENFTFGDTPGAESIASLVNEVLGEDSLFHVAIRDLAVRHDMRELVVKTLLTYLEVEGILVAQGPFYSKLRYQFQRDEQEIVSGFDPRRRSFLEDVFSRAKRGTRWNHLDVDAVADELRQPHKRLIAAMDYLDGQGHILLQAQGVRLRFRRETDEPDVPSLLARLGERFQTRETQDIERVREMMSLVRHAGCRTRVLLAYFGEEIGACGNCDRCLNLSSPADDEPTPPRPTPEDSRTATALFGQGHDALATPRQMARYLCGLTSPAMTRAKLHKRPDFGRCREVRFQEVLEMAESAAAGSRGAPTGSPG